MLSSRFHQLLGVDWGTTNRRAYLIDRSGACLLRHADGEGMLATAGRFEESLRALKASLAIDAAIPVVMSGMVGSAMGWQEVPYLDQAVPLYDLGAHMVPVAGQADSFILPGYRQLHGGVDVMRGEETQLLGSLALGLDDVTVVLPGTHSKWARMRHGRIQGFSTFLTGEMFSLLSEGGTLAPLLSADAPFDEQAFSDGLDQARLGRPLSNTLFGVRARVVTGTMPAAKARSFVSGLLIGTEFVDADPNGPIHIIGSSSLAERYMQAAAFFGRSASVLDADKVYVAALGHLFNRSQHATF